MELKEKIEHGWIHAVIIIEILGRPADHVEKSLDGIIETLGKEKGVEITNKKAYPAKVVEKEKVGGQDLFTSFAEIELLTENLKRLIDIIFIYMPSSIEIIEPQEIKLKTNDANVFVNDLTERLHRYDAIAKTMIMQNSILQNQLKSMQGKESKDNEPNKTEKEKKNKK